MNKLLDPIKFVINHGENVKINEAAIDKYVVNFEPTPVDHWVRACPFEYHSLPNIDDEIDRRFLADAMAFCFWGYPTKWTIEYEGQKLDGWWALIGSLQRALESGTLILEGNHLANMSLADTQNLFHGKPEIPLLQERHKIFNEIGEKLVTKYEGRFHNFYAHAKRDAVELVEQIAAEFPTFDDVAMYKGQKVFFYKKAQLLVDELSDELLDQKYAPITNVAQLTGKADYKIPALLRKLDMLKYSHELAEKVDNREVIPGGSNMEIEIRASMLWVNHLICQKLKEKYLDLTPMTLDGTLWLASQTKSQADKPYHLTLTTNY